MAHDKLIRELHGKTYVLELIWTVNTSLQRDNVDLNSKQLLVASSTVVAGNRLAEGASDAMCPRCRGTAPDVKGCRRWMDGRFRDDDGVKKRDEMSNTINK